MRVGSLFTGVGLGDLGLMLAGMEIAWQVEIDDFCNEILELRWPDVRRYRDVRSLPALEPVDVIFGGPPCQTHSYATRGRATADFSLWREMLEIIREVRPR